MLNIAKTGLFRGWMVDAVAYLALVLEGTCIALLLFRESIVADDALFYLLYLYLVFFLPL